jgi:hypothetical protein
VWLEHLLSGAGLKERLGMKTILALAFLYKILMKRVTSLRAVLLIATKLEAHDSLVAQLVRALH